MIVYETSASITSNIGRNFFIEMSGESVANMNIPTICLYTVKQEFYN